MYEGGYANKEIKAVLEFASRRAERMEVLVELYIKDSAGCVCVWCECVYAITMGQYRNIIIPQILDVRSRLSRLDYLFTNLHLEHEDCRRRILCEVSREPETFAPLSDMVHGETR